MTTTLDSFRSAPREPCCRFLIANIRSPGPVTAAGWCRRRRYASIFCIGASLRFQRVQSADDPAAGCLRSPLSPTGNSPTSVGYFRSRWCFSDCPRGFGRWVEEGGPRKAMFTAGVCWASAFLMSALGVYCTISGSSISATASSAAARSASVTSRRSPR